ncbi:amino acid ABC transporter permease [Paraburkholderia caballeronis]|uniref:Amino acid ABC transporter membrane protein 2, PAAT family n=1 Tax=Paraburkholderia caballeronis TaxID=416943 RepID=A0A1H7RMD6_9BURK|nr:amino acid ABC transporter permease [Paraburkholderia caballeronis]PXW23112.1 amino acid ABC transporter membrane protein 2 (PAAT family) [Paraburkholderia caballeronis]PXW97776.1 amino acid ABC transporter membrane protein 2 (PAAT family) [Paraburkholderia caballeronis]RAJ94746.1 amino acid ABC transporter membrane protein 2 (PAAT family) [Paraburkholderia caballeronis]TDV11726.1 amino acid ABC transporter membrane protein 2 (PAAT family) [Paraburkholderia caballeronis]TDV14807.1 amino aci
MIEFTFWQILENLLLAARWTVVLSLVSFVAGGLVGLVLLVMRVSDSRLLRAIVRVYIEIFQGTPLLMQLFLVFFCLPLVGIDVEPWVAATLGLTFFTSAYLAEIWRGCVEAVPKGQWEASASLAMSYFEQLRHVILPQAARIAIGPTVGFGVQAVKDTALVSIIGFTELTKVGTAISNATFQPFLVYGLVALIYFALCYPLTWSARVLQRKWHAAR